MRQRYFLIEPKYSDPDTFCSFIVGSDRVRASIQIYADLWMFERVAAALTAPSLEEEGPIDIFSHPDKGDTFDFQLTVLPHKGENKRLRFRISQDLLDDGAPYQADIRFDLSPEEAEEFAKELKAWCENPDSAFSWKGD